MTTAYINTAGADEEMVAEAAEEIAALLEDLDSNRIECIMALGLVLEYLVDPNEVVPDRMQ